MTEPKLEVTSIRQQTCLEQPYRMLPNFNFVLIFTSHKQPPALSSHLLLLLLGGCLTHVWLYYNVLSVKTALWYRYSAPFQINGENNGRHVLHIFVLIFKSGYIKWNNLFLFHIHCKYINVKGTLFCVALLDLLYFYVKDVKL